MSITTSMLWAVTAFPIFDDRRNEQPALVIDLIQRRGHRRADYTPPIRLERADAGSALPSHPVASSLATAAPKQTAIAALVIADIG